MMTNQLITTPDELVNDMRVAERIAFTDKEVALKYANMRMAEVLVDLGYSEAIVIYKNIIDTYGG